MRLDCIEKIGVIFGVSWILTKDNPNPDPSEFTQ
jgi:hypothetical protein